MKKSLLIAVIGLVMSANVFAVEYSQENSSKILHSQGYETKQQAYDAGFTIIDELEGASNQELRTRIATNFADNIEVEDAEVQIEEFSNKQGNVQYRAVVDVDYSYEEEVLEESGDH